MRATNLM